MTVERQTELQDRLRELLGERPAATLWDMLPGRDDLVTRSDLSAVRDEIKSDMSELKGEVSELKGEVSDIKTEIASIRQEMVLKFATRDDLYELRRDFENSIQGMVRTFIIVQAATVVGMSGILYGFLRLA